MRDRGIEFKLDTYVDGAQSNTVVLSTEETVQCETFVWTAGNRPNPLLERVTLPTTPHGAISTDETLAVPGRAGVWAAGDCAATYDPETGESYPPTAEYAVREARQLADNVYASTTGAEPEPFVYESQGSLAVIGYQVAVAEVRGQCFSGLFAWLLWRAVYLSKLPGTDRKIRVSLAWVVELFFPRELVQTVGSGGDQRA